VSCHRNRPHPPERDVEPAAQTQHWRDHERQRYATECGCSERRSTRDCDSAAALPSLRGLGKRQCRGLSRRIVQARTVGKQPRHDLVMSSCSCEVEDCSIPKTSCIATLGTERKQQSNDFIMAVSGSEVQRSLTSPTRGAVHQRWISGKQGSHDAHMSLLGCLVHSAGFVDHLNTNLSDEKQQERGEKGTQERRETKKRRGNKRTPQIKEKRRGKNERSFLSLLLFFSSPSSLLLLLSKSKQFKKVDEVVFFVRPSKHAKKYDKTSKGSTASLPNTSHAFFTPRPRALPHCGYMVLLLVCSCNGNRQRDRAASETPIQAESFPPL